MTSTILENVLLRIIRKKEILLGGACLYSLFMTLVLLAVLYQPHGHEGKLDITRVIKDAIITRQWFRDNVDNNQSIGVESVNDVGVDERENASASSLPRNNSIVPGYFILDSDEPFMGRCGKCSLVSSSGHLYHSGAGADIENADCVIRMNTATVKGWEEDVGSRTDIRIIGHVNLPRGLVRTKGLRTEILKDSKTRTKYIIVPWLYWEKINMKTNKIINLARKFKHNYPFAKFVFLTSEKHNESETRYLLETGYTRDEVHTWFSTGFVSVMFALDVCDEVQVFGLANIDYCKSHPKSNVPYHYYEPQKATECQFYEKHEKTIRKGHKFLTEHEMFARWSLIYKLSFHYPSWRATIRNATSFIDNNFLRRYKAALKSGKLHDVPHSVVKNGKRVRIIRRIVRKRVPRDGHKAPPPPASEAKNKESISSKRLNRSVVVAEEEEHILDQALVEEVIGDEHTNQHAQKRMLRTVHSVEKKTKNPPAPNGDYWEVIGKDGKKKKIMRRKIIRVKTNK